jgi:hypothetical protein
MPHPKPRPVTTAAEIVRFGKLFRAGGPPFNKGNAFVAATKGGRGKNGATIRVLSVHPSAAKAWAAIDEAKRGVNRFWKANDSAKLTVFGPIRVQEPSRPTKENGLPICHHDDSCETICQSPFHSTEEIMSIELVFRHRNPVTLRETSTSVSFPTTTDTIFIGGRSFDDYVRHHP